MARSVQAQLEREADAKGLTGDERERYIGGAWQRITGHRDRRQWWRDPDEARLLSKLLGNVEEVKQPASHKADKVFIRSGGAWFELPDTEYHSLLAEAKRVETLERGEDKQLARDAEREAKEIERELSRVRGQHEKARVAAVREGERREKEDKKRKAAEARAIAEYERALALEKRMEERKAEQARRNEGKAQFQAERIARSVERAELAEVRSIIKERGGIKPSVTKLGTKHDTSEYRSLPSDLRNMKGHLTLDTAATEVAQHMPWLNLETGFDLVNYFERVRDVRMNRRYEAHYHRHESAPETGGPPAPLDMTTPAAPMPAAKEAQNIPETIPAPAPVAAAIEHAAEDVPAPAVPDWTAIFGTPEPVKKDEAEASTLFALAPIEGPAIPKHKHLWEPWRQDAHFIRCKKCGHVAESYLAKGAQL